jgi:hypothetical protein
MRKVGRSNPVQVKYDFNELKVIIGNQWSHLSGIEPEYSCMPSERSNRGTTNCYMTVTSTSSNSAHTHVIYAARRERRDACHRRLMILHINPALLLDSITLWYSG